MPAGDSPELIRSADIDQLVRNGIDRLGAMPGVQAAGASCCMPFENDMRLRFVIVGRPLEAVPRDGELAIGVARLLRRAQNSARSRSPVR